MKKKGFLQKIIINLGFARKKEAKMLSLNILERQNKFKNKFKKRLRKDLYKVIILFQNLKLFSK